jgi:hypothetical protein
MNRGSPAPAVPPEDATPVAVTAVPALPACNVDAVSGWALFVATVACVVTPL